MPANFEQAYEEHVDRVYAYLAYRVSTRADAEDLTQVTFERALRAWPQYDPERAGVATWILTIARNAWIDHRRRAPAAGPLSLSQGDVGDSELPRTPGPEARIGLSPELATALDRLRVRDREIVALRFGADLRAPEIAEMLGLSIANVQQILSRTLRRLRRHLEGSPPGSELADASARAAAGPEPGTGS